jgi:sirohydrochlorin ferrochelatase
LKTVNGVVADRWRKIPISLDPPTGVMSEIAQVFGEQTAQACANAC